MSKKNHTQNIFEAFTLAEVLITLGIIGVVAALTIPAVLNQTQEREFKVAYKKAYSTVAQAFNQAKANGEIVSLTGTYSSQGGEENFNAIKKYFKIAKECDSLTLNECWNPDGDVFRASGDADSFIDNSGMAWKLRELDCMAAATHPCRFTSWLTE